MRRSKLGDVYATKLPNGYKIFQRAYDIPRRGDFVRVFDGLYESIPANVEEIVRGPHSYIVYFFSSRAYRVGLAQFIGNYPIPKEYPFPEYMIRFFPATADGIFSVNVTRTDLTEQQVFYVRHLCELPEKFRNIKLLDIGPTPVVLFYLFDNNCTLADLPHFYSHLRISTNDLEKYQVYLDMVNEAMEKDRAKRRGEALGN